MLVAERQERRNGVVLVAASELSAQAGCGAASLKFTQALESRPNNSLSVDTGAHDTVQRSRHGADHSVINAFQTQNVDDIEQQ